MHFVVLLLKNAEEVIGAKLTKSVLAQSENLLLVIIDMLYKGVDEIFSKVNKLVKFNGQAVF